MNNSSTLKFNDFLKQNGINANTAKIKLNSHNGYDDPYALYLKTPTLINNEWLFYRHQRRNFDCGNIAVCFVKVDDDEWLLTTIKRVAYEFQVKDDVNYAGIELPQFKPYFGKLRIRYPKFHRQNVVRASGYAHLMEVI